VADTASGVFGAVTEEETEEEVGGYLYDLSFVLESLTSKAFRIVGVFMVALAGVFFWLNRGGLGAIRDSFLARLPAEIRPSELTIIALHPAEALVFEVKVATIVAGVVTLPVAAYYAWPSVRDRGWADGSRSTIGVWGVVLVVGTIAGSTFGFAYVAPAAVSYLVEDAVGAGVIVSYRLKQFFWLIFLTTVGVGLLANVPVSMVLLERTGLVSYRGFRDQWREVVVAIVVGAAFLTPGVVQMLVVSVPVAAAYLIGLGLLWVTSLVGRRNGRGGDPSTIGGG
jgi:sec-independent protein translocase protein TatC